MKPERVGETHQSKLEQLRERKRRAAEGGGSARVERQHKAGKWTARQRIDFFLDEEEFERHAERYKYPPLYRRRVGEAIEEIVSLIERRQFPFSFER